MALAMVLISAFLLSIERIAYLLIWYHPDRFGAICGRTALKKFGEPIEILQKLFYFFKALQLSVFMAWCLALGEGGMPLPTGTPLSLTVGGALILLGMFLNASVFSSLGKVGVFYGNKLGYHVPWRNGFPFSLCKHPQYVGAVIAIWGFFLVMRFPHGDWIVLPLIETLYYAIGARYER